MSAKRKSGYYGNITVQAIKDLENKGYSFVTVPNLTVLQCHVGPYQVDVWYHPNEEYYTFAIIKRSTGKHYCAVKGYTEDQIMPELHKIIDKGLYDYDPPGGLELINF